MTTSDIFLSYNREDQAVAQRFAEGFEAAGLTVWWDVTLRSGEAYDQVTEEALRTAKAVVVLWSPRSVASRWVRAEASIADENKTLAPVKIEACVLPVMFRLTQTADLSTWRGETDEPAWLSFLGDVRRMVDDVTDTMRPVEPPLANSVSRLGSRTARPSIAVLPFLNRTGLAEHDLLAESIVEDMTGALSASLWMRVIASSATADYRKEARDLRQIGHSLGARYLLEGNVRKASNDLRVTAQLVEAESGDILWTQRFDRPLSETGDFQDGVIAEIVAHVTVQVRRAEVEHAWEKSDDLTAWEAFARSLTSGENQTRAGYELSISQLEKAASLAPNDRLAYALLAAQQGQMLHLGGGDDPELERQIVDNIRRARAIEPNKPDILIWVAGALIGLRRLDDALPVAQRAVALWPNDDFAHHMLGAVLARQGRLNEAIAELDEADRLAPGGGFLNTGSLNRSIAYAIAGQFQQALEAIGRSAGLLPGPELLIQTMLSRAKLDLWEQAREDMRQLRNLHPATSRPMLEGLVCSLYCGADPVHRDNYASIVTRLWDQTDKAS
jgi:TolB-like protein/Flp pilus assembly protein TadD